MDGRDAQDRAKSDDREAAIDLIERAHAEGRIGSADRTIRKNNVATATTLGELAMITRDLAGAPAQPAYDEPAVAPVPEPAADAYDEPLVAVGGEPPAPSFGQPPPQPPPPTSYPLPPQAYMTRSVVVRRSGAGAPLLLGLVVALIGVAIAGSVFLTTIGVPDIEIGQPDPVVQAEDRYALDEEGFRWVVDRYRREFGSTVVVRAVFYDGYAIFDVPDEDGRPEHTGWIYRDGGFTEMGGARVNAADAVTVNLNRVDYAALEESLDLARRTLNVEDGEVSHVIIGDDPFAGRPTATIYVTNQVNANGFLTTDLRGKVLRSFPHAG